MVHTIKVYIWIFFLLNWVRNSIGDHLCWIESTGQILNVRIRLCSIIFVVESRRLWPSWDIVKILALLIAMSVLGRCKVIVNLVWKCCIRKIEHQIAWKEWALWWILWKRWWCRVGWWVLRIERSGRRITYPHVVSVMREQSSESSQTRTSIPPPLFFYLSLVLSVKAPFINHFRK